jgi:orotate phosphoribosyltransferase
MSDAGNRIGEMLLETGAIAYYKERPFVFVSGRISPVYIDCRRLLSFPEAREAIIVEMARKADSAIGRDAIDVVAGGETAGIPYAALVAQKLGKPMIYIRKQPKGYGGTKQIEGILEADKRVLLVEDLITDGMSKLRFNIGIRGAGSKMTDCLCVFEYGSDELNLHEGKVNLAEHGIASHALANWDHVLSAGRGKNYLSDDATRQILDFLKDPENWGRKMGFV